jgi:hypothetical protein
MLLRHEGELRKRGDLSGHIRDMGGSSTGSDTGHLYIYMSSLHTNIHTALSSSSDLRGSTQPLLWKAIHL